MPAPWIPSHNAPPWCTMKHGTGIPQSWPRDLAVLSGDESRAPEPHSDWSKDKRGTEEEQGSSHVITGWVFFLTYTWSRREGLLSVISEVASDGPIILKCGAGCGGVNHDWEWRLWSSRWPEWGKSSPNHPIKLTQYYQCQALEKENHESGPTKSWGLKKILINCVHPNKKQQLL